MAAVRDEREWLASTDPRAMLKALSEAAPATRGLRRRLRLFACACARHALAEPCARCGGTGRLPGGGPRCPACGGAPKAAAEFPGAWAAVEVAERFADREAAREELEAAQDAVDRVHDWRDLAYTALPDTSGWSRDRLAWWAVRACLMGPFVGARHAAANHAVPDASRAALFRDVVPHPFSARPRWADDPPVGPGPEFEILDPAVLKWDGGTVPRLARAIYDERRFQDLPVLADALLEAGVDEDEHRGIIEHLRGVEGCPACDGAGVVYDHPQSLASRRACRACREGMRPCGPHARGCWVLDLFLREE